jgi:tRNA A37 methylthiotransferase MiaB
LELLNYSAVKSLGVDYKHEFEGAIDHNTQKNYAYLKISEGCDRPCSFVHTTYARKNAANYRKISKRSGRFS